MRKGSDDMFQNMQGERFFFFYIFTSESGGLYMKCFALFTPPVCVQKFALALAAVGIVLFSSHM